MVEYTPVRGAGIEYNGSVVVRIQKGFRFRSNVVEVYTKVVVWMRLRGFATWMTKPHDTCRFESSEFVKVGTIGKAC